GSSRGGDAGELSSAPNPAGEVILHCVLELCIVKVEEVDSAGRLENRPGDTHGTLLRSIQTQVRIELQESISYDVNQVIHLTFALKEFRAAIALAESLDLSLQNRFGIKDQPLFILLSNAPPIPTAYNHSSMPIPTYEQGQPTVSAKFVLATTQEPDPADSGSADRTPLLAPRQSPPPEALLRKSQGAGSKRDQSRADGGCSGDSQQQQQEPLFQPPSQGDAEQPLFQPSQGEDDDDDFAAFAQMEDNLNRLEEQEQEAAASARAGRPAPTGSIGANGHGSAQALGIAVPAPSHGRFLLDSSQVSNCKAEKALLAQLRTDSPSCTSPGSMAPYIFCIFECRPFLRSIQTQAHAEPQDLISCDVNQVIYLRFLLERYTVSPLRAVFRGSNLIPY
ncbi:hypothetical protein OC842_007566, partial [Tilletia horrida]